jgi:hypothetical protein
MHYPAMAGSMAALSKIGYRMKGEGVKGEG